MSTRGHLQTEEIKLPPGNEWMDETNAWRLIRVRSGASYWLGPGLARPLSAGEVIVAPPGAPGMVRASQIGEVVLDAFNFSLELIFGLFTLTERHLIETGGALGLRQVRFLPSTHPVSSQFAAMSEGSRHDNGLGERIDALGVVGAVFDISLAGRRAAVPHGRSAGQRFQQLVASMPDSELINHSPEELARLCGCSPRHFNRLFQKRFGVSARTRQTELRLVKASRLLRETGSRIVEIAGESGYRNLSLFNALFKKRFGMTPSEWRKSTPRGTTTPPNSRD